MLTTRAKKETCIHYSRSVADFMEGINDDFKEGNEGINDGREMNYQINYGSEMNYLTTSNCLCTDIFNLSMY